MNEGIITEIEAEIKNLELERMQIMQAVGEINGQIKRYKKALDVLVGSSSKTKNSSSKKALPKEIHIENALKAMEDNPDVEYTSEDIARVINMSISTGTAVLNALRERGSIDLVRQGGKTGTLRFYKAAIKVGV